MYSTLSQYNDTTSMDTSDKKYSCPNYVHSKTQNFYNYFNLPSSQNTNVEQLPFYKVNQKGKVVGQSDVLPALSTKESFLPSYSMETDTSDITVDNEKSISLDETMNLDNSTSTMTKSVSLDETTNLDKSINTMPKSMSVPKGLSRSSQSLLPVLDCHFNLREICKQSILLEEHLTQPEKRCTDCCIKHFLALEGLSEEAISLDKEQKGPPIMKDLPTLIRSIQKHWYTNPDKNSHSCSQQLRSIRKSLMESCFPVIFDEKQNKLKSCSASACQLR